MIKTLIAVAAVSVFALPVTASAGSDNIVVAQGGGGGGGGGADGPDMANRRPGTTSSQPGTMDSDKVNAGSGASGRRGNFDRLDRNRDGYISRDEANDAPELQTRFSELDTNNDGKLSREEYDALKSSAAGSSAGSTAARK